VPRCDREKAVFFCAQVGSVDLTDFVSVLIGDGIDGHIARPGGERLAPFRMSSANSGKLFECWRLASIVAKANQRWFQLLYEAM
jgi:hypothetical protein